MEKQEASRGEPERERGVADQGTRSQVTAGKNMDGFSKLIVAIAKANGLKDAEPFGTRCAHLARLLSSDKAVGHSDYLQRRVGGGR